MAASSNPEKVVIWTIAATAFFGFFRLGELLPGSIKDFNPAFSLTWGDVVVDNRMSPKIVQIHLKKTKCNQFGPGSDVIVGHVDSPLCPVTAILHYIEWRGTQPGPFFLNSSKEPVIKHWFVAQVALF